MTVVAYSSKHRVMAADSRCTDAFGMHLTSCRKVFTLTSGAILGSAGDADGRDFVALLDKAPASKLPTRSELAELKGDFYGLLVFRNGRIFTVLSEWKEHEHEGEYVGEVVAIRDRMIAIGSGSPYAYGAMGVGADPVAAVKAACRRDTMCFPPVQSARLE